MKIILEQNDMENANRINDDVKKNEDIPLFVREDGTYHLRFKVTDTGKANVFISYLLQGNKSKEIEAAVGIHVSELVYRDNMKNKVVNGLKNLLREVEGM